MKFQYRICALALCLTLGACSEQSSESSHVDAEIDFVAISGYATATTPAQRLLSAAYLGDLDKIKDALAHGADVNSTGTRGGTPLQLAATYGNLEAVEYLVEKGARVNTADPFGRTALHLSSTWGHTDVVMFLIEHGADIGLRTRHGESALQAAINIGNMNIIHALQDAQRSREPASAKKRGIVAE